MVIELLAIPIGIAIAKAILKTWLKDKPLLDNVTQELIDIVADIGKEKTEKRDEERHIEKIGGQIAQRMKPIFEHEGKDLPIEEQDAIIFEFAITLQKADLTTQQIIIQNLDSQKLNQHLKDVNPDATRDFAAGGTALYERMLKEASKMIVVTADQLASFVPLVSAASLQNQEKILDGIYTLLLLPTQKDEEFERKYLRAIVNGLDRMELFGIQKMDEITSQQKLTVAYVAIQAEQDFDISDQVSEEITNRLVEIESISKKSISYEEFYKLLKQGEDLVYIVEGLAERWWLGNAELKNLRIQFSHQSFESFFDYSAIERANSIDSILKSTRRIIVRGEAGSGKSTLLQWLAVRSGQRDITENLSFLKDTVPFFYTIARKSERRLSHPRRISKISCPKYHWYYANWLGTPAIS